MTTIDRVQLMRHWFHEVWNEGKTNIVLQHTAPDLVGYGQGEAGKQVRSPQQFLEFVFRIRGAFPDLRVTVEDAFGADDKVAVRWSATGTHKGDHLGIKASGKKMEITGITIARFSGDKLVEGWDSWDQLEMLKAIGAVEIRDAKIMSATP